MLCMEFVGIIMSLSYLCPHLEILKGNSRNKCVSLLVASSFPNLIGISSSQLAALLVTSSFPNVLLRGVYSVSNYHNLVAQLSTGSGYDYRANGECSHFVVCLLQKN